MRRQTETRIASNLTRRLAVIGAAVHLGAVPVWAQQTERRSPAPAVSGGAAATRSLGMAGPRPTQSERRQFLIELERMGWHAQLSEMPSAFVQRPDGHVDAVRVRPAAAAGDVDGDGRVEWVVAYYFQSDDPTGIRALDDVERRKEPPAPEVRTDDRARIVIFKRDGGGRWRFHWRSPGLGHAFRTSEYNVQEVQDGLDTVGNLRPALALVDVDGDQTLEIAYQCASATGEGGNLPGVYRHTGGRWVSVAPQADRFTLLDLDHDGRLEVVTGSRFVGAGGGDDDVPRAWRWNGRQYQEASSSFPAFYAGLVARYQQYVKRHEKDGPSFNREMWDRAILKAGSLAG
jgi:hypothetical protein